MLMKEIAESALSGNCMEGRQFFVSKSWYVIGPISVASKSACEKKEVIKINFTTSFAERSFQISVAGTFFKLLKKCFWKKFF